MMRGLAGDVRLGVRSMRAAPLVTVAAVVTLALGIGTTTAIFSVANGLMLRPLPVRSPQRLATVTSETALRFGFQAGAGWSYAMWERLRPRTDAFAGAFAWTMQRVDLSDAGESDPAEAVFASGDFFTTLGVAAVLGRTFTSANDVRGGGPDGAVVVISHALWERRFNRASTVLGARLPIDGVPFTVIGVAPRGFRGVDVGQGFDVALPLGLEPLIRGAQTMLDNQRSLVLTVMLRLKPQQTIAQATAALRQMQPQIVGRDAPKFVQEPFIVVPAATGISDRSRLRQQYERPLVVLAIVSGLVLLIASVNVAHLLLARAAARRGELSLRLALGAPPWRLARQLLLEGLVLGTLGAAAGLLFATWGSRALVAQLPASGGAVLLDVSIDWRVLAFATAIALLGVALFGTIPAFHAMRVPPLDALQDDRRFTGGRRSRAVSNALIVAQVAVSIVLVAAAALFVRTLDRLANVPLGFEPKALLIIDVNTARALVPSTTRLALYQRIVEATSAVPGVTHAAGSVWTPLGSGGGGLLTDAGGRRAATMRQVGFNFVTPGWFSTYGTAIRTGRDFDLRDSATAPRVALVNETLHSLLPAGTALGDTVDAGPCGRGGCTIVGIVADAVYGRSLRDGPPPTIYLPLAQSAGVAPPGTVIRVTVRTAAEPGLLISSLSAALRDLDRELAFTFRPLARDVDAAVAQERLVARLAALFGAIGLILSAFGLYGVTAYAVTLRRGEIGVRLALGARPQAVVRLMLRRVGLLVGAGTACGLIASLWLSRFVAPLLYGLHPRDPLTLLVAASTLAAVGGLAGWIPAARAARVDPAQVLRES